MTQNKMHSYFGIVLVSLATSVCAINIVTLPTPPFTIDTGSEWEGFDFDVFNFVYDGEYSYDDVFTRDTISEVISAVVNGTADIGFAALTMTGPREELVDFTHVTFDSGLRVMAHNDINTSAVVSKFFKSFFNAQFIFTMFILVFVVFLISTIVWAIEVFFTKNSDKFFDAQWKTGLLMALTWTAMNLLKNETKTPRHPVGKGIKAFLSVGGIVFLASLTAYISAQMILLSQTPSKVQSLDDLVGKKVGTVAGSTSFDYLKFNGGGVVIRTYPTLDDVFEAFHSRELEGVLYDFPILLYHVNQRESTGVFDSVVVGPVLDKQSYGFIIAQGDPLNLKEDINKMLLNFVYSDSYFSIHDRYFSVEGGDAETTGLDISAGSWVVIFLLFFMACGLVRYVILKIRDTPEKKKFSDKLNEEMGTIRAYKIDDLDNFKLNVGIYRTNILLLRMIQTISLSDRKFVSEAINEDEFDVILKESQDDLLRCVKDNQPIHYNPNIPPV